MLLDAKTHRAGTSHACFHAIVTVCYFSGEDGLRVGQRKHDFFPLFFPNPHSKGFHSALRYKNPVVTSLIYTVKSIKDKKHLPLPQAPGFSDLSDWWQIGTCHCDLTASL